MKVTVAEGSIHNLQRLHEPYKYGCHLLFTTGNAIKFLRASDFTLTNTIDIMMLEQIQNVSVDETNAFLWCTDGYDLVKCSLQTYSVQNTINISTPSHLLGR